MMVPVIVKFPEMTKVHHPISYNVEKTGVYY